jgi:hypothetical protein
VRSNAADSGHTRQSRAGGRDTALVDKTTGSVNFYVMVQWVGSRRRQTPTVFASAVSLDLRGRKHHGLGEFSWEDRHRKRDFPALCRVLTAALSYRVSRRCATGTSPLYQVAPGPSPLPPSRFSRPAPFDTGALRPGATPWAPHTRPVLFPPASPPSKGCGSVVESESAEHARQLGA